VTPVVVELQLLMMKLSSVLLELPNPPTVPRLTFFQSPFGWWTAVTAVPSASVDESQPASTVPAGGVAFSRSSSASDGALA
jgi:hypothetical protein